MKEPRTPEPVLLIAAVFSRYPELLEQARERLIQAHGPLQLQSDAWPFTQTTYYHHSMGQDLLKQFLVFKELIDPARLPDIKRQTIKFEQEWAANFESDVERPINIDPGLISLGKLMLATTKDQMHRIYLRDGIYAEVTLFFQHGRFQPWPWTYADYRQEHVQEFFKEARQYLYQQLRRGGEETS